MMARKRSRAAGCSRADPRSVSMNPDNAASGVRSSWLALATKSARISRPGLLLLAFHELTPLRRVEEMRADLVAHPSRELRPPLAALSAVIVTLRRASRGE